MNPSTENKLLQNYSRAEKRLLLLDYDGTLTPLVSLPEFAKPNDELLILLNRLTQDEKNEIYIISGRDRNTLNKWLGHLKLNFIAEHGSWIKGIGEEWQTTSSISTNWMEPVKSVLENYTRGCPGAFVESKTFSLAWHYRNVNETEGPLRAKELLNELQKYTERWDITVINGNKVIEVKSKGFSKGKAVGNILNQKKFDFIFACGDDTTDEDMFKQLADVANAFTIKVGNLPTYAKHTIENTEKALSLLRALASFPTPVGEGKLP